VSEKGASALRATIKKPGGSEVQVELYRTGPSSFQLTENGGIVGAFMGSSDLRETWDRCIAKRYPEHQVSHLEEWFPE